jgi:hypothetical protein
VIVLIVDIDRVFAVEREGNSSERTLRVMAWPHILWRKFQHDGYQAAATLLGGQLDLLVARHFGGAGTSPYLDMTDRSAALSGGPPALTTMATSLKYWAPMSGDRTIKALAASVNGFEKP